MNGLSKTFKLATRSSRLALIQAEEAVKIIVGRMPSLKFDLVPCSSPGDRDKTTDLQASAADFFTRDLHEAVLDGLAACAVHSAKDLEDSPPRRLDWFWLPDPAKPNDVLVARRGEKVADVKDEGIIGVSSQRREQFCRRNFPKMRINSIRGTIEERIAQLDDGKYDLLITAEAALQRLGLEERISQRISSAELSPPEGQGVLALVFQSDDQRFLRLRSLFVKPVVFAGAGPPSLELCTLETLNALKRCEVCFHDNLLDLRLLEHLPSEARRIGVGKRCGGQQTDQKIIDKLVAQEARRGRRVVRLKGGDPGIFGRLGEETASLDELHLPYRVIPGVSSLNAATTGTGLLLTRRGISQGFTVITPRQENGGFASVQSNIRSQLPMVFFMGIRMLREIVSQLEADRIPARTPAAIVFNAGTADETII